MPAIDQCEPQVIAALEKQGWRVTHQPLVLRLSKLELVYPDLRLEHQESHEIVIVVEVKCFPSEAWLDEFYSVVGQYLYYREMLRAMGKNDPLFVAVPLEIFHGLFSRQVIKSVVQSIQMKLIVVDVELAEVIEWKR